MTVFKKVKCAHERAPADADMVVMDNQISLSVWCGHDLVVKSSGIESIYSH